MQIDKPGEVARRVACETFAVAAAEQREALSLPRPGPHREQAVERIAVLCLMAPVRHHT
jgi:hypothetical protein